MALPLKTGADLYTQELIRARLQNFGGDLPEYGAGSIYFNTIDDITVNSSNRIRYRSLRAWHSIANTDDIDALQKQLDELDFAGSEEFIALDGRVDTLEEKFSAFFEGGANPDSVLDSLNEIQAFLDNYSDATSLSEIIGELDAKIADRYTKAESDERYLKLTGGDISGTLGIGGTLTMKSYIRFNQYAENKEYLLGMTNEGGPIRWYDGTKWNTLLHASNYSDLVTTLNNQLTVPSIKIGGIVLDVVDGNLRISGNAYATGELGSGQVAGEGGGGSTGGGYTAFDDSVTWADYNDSMADWLLTAYHGKLFNDRIATLENKATKVEVSNLLTSGTKIATIKVDANSYDILAPSTDWSAITNKPTTIDGYGITDAFKAYGTARNTDLNTVKTNGSYYLIDSTINKPSTYGQMLSLRNADTTAQVYVGYNTFDNMYWRGFTDSDTNIMAWRKILDENNYDSVIGSTYTRKEEVITYNTGIDISGDTIPLHDIGYGMTSNGWERNAVAMSIGYSQSYWAQLQFGNGLMTFRTNVGGTMSDWVKILTDNNYETVLNKTYLRNDGAAINGYLSISAAWPAITFIQNDVRGEGIGVNQGKLVCYNAAGTNTYEILHRNNYLEIIGECLRTDGSNVMNSGIKWKVVEHDDWNIISTGKNSGLRIVNATGNGDSYMPSSYAVGLSVSGHYGFNIAYEISGKSFMFKGGLTSDAWKTIAFTDSDITGNAETATKLKNSVTLWGNTFDGTQGLNGNITLNNNTRIGFNYGDTAYNAISFNTVGTLAIGYDGATFRGLATHIYGGSIAFLTAAAGGTPTQAMKINESGNVVIGGYSPVLSRKLTVNNGGTFLYAHNSGTASPDLGTPFEKALLVGYDTFGMQIWTNSNGSSYIQNSYFNGTATALPIYINPLGGNVNIASANATTNVLGLLKVTSRVLIGNVVDDGSSTLQLYGDILAHSTNINFKSTGGWAKGMYALDSNGNRLGGIGFYIDGDVLNKIWIGSFDNPWIAINSTEANFNILTKFNSSVKIGEATLSYENGALKVDKNFFAEGEVASGKVAAEGTGGNTPSGSGLEIKTFDIASTTENQMVELAHNLGTRDVVVQIFENSPNSNYQQVFADVYYVDTAKVAINFGAAQTVPHRVIIMG